MDEAANESRGVQENSQITDTQKEETRPSAPKPKRKPSKRVVPVSADAFQSLLSSIVETDDRASRAIGDKLSDCGIAYLIESGELYAVCLSPASYDKMLRSAASQA